MSAETVPDIADYALLADCHSVALVSHRGSIDWCCMPRLDSPSCFARLLDPEVGGFCALGPRDGDACTARRRYLDGSLVLETTFESDAGAVRLVDCIVMRRGGREAPHQQLIRIVEGVRGELALAVRVAPRFEYGLVKPWIRRHGDHLFTAIGGSDGLLIDTDLALARDGAHDLAAEVVVREGERYHLSLRFRQAHRLYPAEPEALAPGDVDERMERTLAWWRRWSGQLEHDGPRREEILRSAVVLKALTNASTGATAAAATTSLPESPGGSRNWDYRYSWIRDSSYTLRSLVRLGFVNEADGFRRFIERSAAGSVRDLQILYGVDGRCLLPEVTLDHLAGYRGARPVRIGNAAATQLQLDIYGELLELSWRWFQREGQMDEAYWEFLVQVVETALDRWEEPDSGIWEMRGPPRHFVHSKVLCWAAVDRGLRLAEALGAEVPTDRWGEARARIRDAVEDQGFDPERGIFVQSFGSTDVDAALLHLPTVDFVAWADPRMRRTVEAIATDLVESGLVRRYAADDGLDGREGTFLPCTFWLAECLAHQGERERALAFFERAREAANDLALFSEEFDPGAGQMLGNFPQGLTHFGHIAAALALDGDPES